MNSPKRGLGRGLGALIPTAPHSRQASRPASSPPDDPGHPPERVGQALDASTVASPAEASPQRAISVPAQPASGPTDTFEEAADARAGAYFTQLQTGSVRPNPRQPRTVFDEEAMTELAASVAAVGVLQPVVVRPATGGHFELVMGERRWRAAVQAGLHTIPALVRATADDDLLRDALLENLHRASLNPLEEAAAYQQLLDDFGSTHEELAARLGRSRPHISNTLRLLKLSPAVQRRVAAGVLTAGHARALVAVESAADQERLAARVVAEGLSVRNLEELIAGGGQDQTRRVPSRARVAAPGLTDIAERLSERFETRCRVELGQRKGKIAIEFASLDDLDRILGILEPSAQSR